MTLFVHPDQPDTTIFTLPIAINFEVCPMRGVIKHILKFQFCSVMFKAQK